MIRQSISAPTLDANLTHNAPAAFASVRAEIHAIPATTLLPINLDISRAARRGLVVAERVAPLIPQLALLPGLDLRAIEKLYPYALALLHTHALVTYPREHGIPLSVLVDEATRLRANLLHTSRLLAHFGLISEERVATFRLGKSHVDLANTLLGLGVLLADVWSQVQDKVVVTRAEVDRSIALSGLLHEAIGTRESCEDPLAKPMDPRFVRAQAYTLFARAYDECRRGVSYLRWHERDALRLVPSLYPRRASRAKVHTNHEGTTDEALAPSRAGQREGHLANEAPAPSRAGQREDQPADEPLAPSRAGQREHHLANEAPAPSRAGQREDQRANEALAPSRAGQREDEPAAAA